MAIKVVVLLGVGCFLGAVLVSFFSKQRKCAKNTHTMSQSCVQITGERKKKLWTKKSFLHKRCAHGPCLQKPQKLWQLWAGSSGDGLEAVCVSCRASGCPSRAQSRDSGVKAGVCAASIYKEWEWTAFSKLTNSFQPCSMTIWPPLSFKVDLGLFSELVSSVAHVCQPEFSSTSSLSARFFSNSKQFLLTQIQLHNNPRTLNLNI